MRGRAPYAVVPTVRALVGRHDVRRERSAAVQATQRAVHRRIADLGEPGRPQATQYVVAVAITLGHDREDGRVERAPEKGWLVSIARWTLLRGTQ